MTRQLYHFTSLLWLSPIMREGIKLGEIPVQGLRYEDRPHLPNLTSVSDPSRQSCWCPAGHVIDKTRVRLAVRLSDDEVLTFNEIRERYRMSRKWVKALAPHGEHRRWYFAKNAIAPDKIHKVEIAIVRPHEYRSVDGENLDRVCKDIDFESQRAFDLDTKTGMLRPIGSSIETSWLIDGKQFLQPRGLYRRLPFKLPPPG